MSDAHRKENKNMKKLTAFILSAALVLSMAGCTDSSNNSTGSNIPVASQKVNSHKDPDSSLIPGKDILTPATTEAQEFIKTQYSNYTYYSTAEEYDRSKGIRKYYEGQITNEDFKHELFESICSVLKQGELTLKREQQVTGGANPFLTMENAGGAKYTLSEGILIHNPTEEGGDSIYIFTAPHSTLYFSKDPETDEIIKALAQDGVKTDSNLVRTETVTKTQPAPSDPKAVIPQQPIAYLSIRSNFAWGQNISGTCVDTAGNVYHFDFSKTYDSSTNGKFEDSILELIYSQGAIPNEVLADVSAVRLGMAYAAKIFPNAKVKTESKMCDYGQNTLYAVVNGKAVMLYSKGDVDKTVEDEYAAKTIDCYTKAMSLSVGPAICE